ncbi:transposable element Tc1 transposase [Trichonephila clavipes]|nr:transposable element Tc1 transposase [Trichonephila clavipes]
MLIEEWTLLPQTLLDNLVLSMDIDTSKQLLQSSKVHQELVLVRQELKHLGFHGRATTHKPNITPQNAKHRFQWCRAHRHWTEDMWKTVLWSDESGFIVWLSDGGVWVWRMLAERFFSDCIMPTVKFGGGRIMVFLWGRLSWFGLGPSVPVIENMN